MMKPVTVTCTLTVEDLQQRGACREALDWLAEQDHTDLVVVWQDCTRADWMLWLLAELDIDQRLLVQIACALVRRTPLADGRTVWDLLTDEWSRRAIEAAEGWVAGTVTEEEMIAAADAADAAADATFRVAVDDSAYAAADASYAAARAAIAAYATAAYAAYAADATANATDVIQADIVREYIIIKEH